MRAPTTQLFVLLSLLTACPGCVLTSSAWRQAEEEQMGLPVILGTIQATPDARPTAIVVAYTVDSFLLAPRKVPALIPLDAEGCPAGPFAYIGPEPVSDDIRGKVAEPQRQAVLAWRLDDAARVEGGRALRSRQFVPAGRRRGVRVEPLFDFGRDPSIHVLAYTPADAPGLSPEADEKFPETLRADARVVLLPRYLPRASRERHENAMRSAFLTPLLLVADVVVTPVFLVLYATTGPRC